MTGVDHYWRLFLQLAHTGVGTLLFYCAGNCRCVTSVPLPGFPFLFCAAFWPQKQVLYAKRLRQQEWLHVNVTMNYGQEPANTLCFPNRQMMLAVPPDNYLIAFTPRTKPSNFFLSN